MLPVADNTAVGSAPIHHSGLNPSVPEFLTIDIELAPRQERRPSQGVSELRQSQSSITSLEDIELDEVDVEAPQTPQPLPRQSSENAGLADNQDAAPSLTPAAAFKKALLDHISPKILGVMVGGTWIIGEVVSSILKVHDVGCDEEHVTYEANTGEELCVLNGEVMKEVIGDPETHLRALAFMGICSAAMMSLMMPNIIRTAKEYLNPQTLVQQTTTSAEQQPARPWTGDHEVTFIDLDHALTIKNHILEQSAEESDQSVSLFELETVDEIFNSGNDLVFIKQGEKYQFCKEDNMVNWVERKKGQLIDPRSQEVYVDPEIYVYKVNQQKTDETQESLEVQSPHSSQETQTV